MKTALVYYTGSPAADVAFESALTLVARSQGYLEGIFVGQLPPIIAGEGITLPGDYMAQLMEENKAQASRARERFNTLCTRHQVVRGQVDDIGDQPVAGWRDAEGSVSEAVGEYGRIFDLVVVSRDRAAPAAGDWKHVFETALFDAGRPVLVAGEQTPESLGRRILLSWNCSTETARTVAVSMPLLREADEVLVLQVTGGTVPGPDAAQLAAHLVRGGVAARAETVDAGDRGVGGTILDYATHHSADLIVKGAYTQSRLRQMIFGGPTSDILSNAEIPVLFAH